MSSRDSPVEEKLEPPAVPAPVPAPAPAAPNLPPEEGFRGWLCVAGGFICLFCSFGFLNAIGVFQTTYQETTLRNYTPSDISWIFALQLTLMWLPGPLFGRLVDTYGPGPVLYPSAFLCIFGLCMTSLANQYYQILLAQGLVFGIGAGGTFTAAFICVGQWFSKRRGLATGIASSGSSVGGVIFPIFLNRLTQSIGLDGALRYTALFIGILLLISCFMITARLPRKKWDPNFKWFHASLFKQAPFSIYSLGAFLTWWGLWGPFDFISGMAQSVGIPADLSLYLISIINATSVPGRILPSYMGDKYGHFNVITICAFVTGGSMLVLWLPFSYHPSTAGIIVFGAIYGFVSGAFVSLLMPCVAKVGTLDTIGQRFGTFQTVIGLGSLTGLPIMGAILDRQGDVNFTGLQIFCGASALLGASLLAAATYMLGTSRKTRKI